jgi:hypothetical protein
VMVGEEWPMSSDTTFTGSPAASISEAAVCRVSCSRIRRSPAAADSFVNWRLIVSGR